MPEVANDPYDPESHRFDAQRYPTLWKLKCFPHIDFTWVGHPGILWNMFITIFTFTIFPLLTCETSHSSGERDVSWD